MEFNSKTTVIFNLVEKDTFLFFILNLFLPTPTKFSPFISPCGHKPVVKLAINWVVNSTLGENNKTEAYS